MVVDPAQVETPAAEINRQFRRRASECFEVTIFAKNIILWRSHLHDARVSFNTYLEVLSRTPRSSPMELVGALR